MSSIFLSYSSKDKRFARRLAKDIVRHNFKVWVDEAEMLVGDSLFERIEKGIRETEYLGVILSPNSVQSEWVKKEVEIALNDEIHGRRVRVLPILYKPCEVPSFLRGKVWVDFSNSRLYDRSLGLLINRLSPFEASAYSPLKNWTPKVIRLGLSSGLLISAAGKIGFSNRLIRALCHEGRQWAQSDKELLEGWEECIIGAMAKATFKGKEKTIPMYEEEGNFLFSEMSFHVIDYLISVGARAEIIRIGSGTAGPHKELVDELLDVILVHAHEIDDQNDLRRFLARTFVDLAKARFMINYSEKVNHSHIVGMFALTILPWREKLEQLFT